MQFRVGQTRPSQTWLSPGLRTAFVLVLASLIGVGMPGHANAEKRLALVIGNASYAESPLKNPLNDAADMAAVLEELGFDVILRTDADRREMARAIREFGRRLKQDRGVGLFYYAGHGMQLENRNYLIPVDTPMYDEDEVPYESVDVGSVLAKMQSAGNALNLLILDACRNNPFPTQFRSTNRGLARVDAPVGSLVVYATAPGKVASDGDGRNGIFTGHLLRYLGQQGLSLTQTIRKTRAAVVQETAGRQVPWESSSLLQDYYLKPQNQESTANATQKDVTTNLDALFWQSAQAGNTVAEYQAYLNRFPSGMFTDLARVRISQLQNVTIASVDTNQQLQPKPSTNTVKLNNTEPDTKDSPRTKALNLSLAEESTQLTKTTRPDTGTELPARLSDADPNPQLETKNAAKTTADQQEATRLAAINAELKSTTHRPANTQDDTSVTSKLTVEVVPTDARIRIMNIVEKYHAGIVLEPDETYDVYVTRAGFKSWRQQITLTKSNTVLNVELVKLDPVYPTLKPIAKGTYRMGCSAGDRDCAQFEKPHHSVSIAAFSMSPTEITVGQFRSFVEQSGYITDAEKNTGGFKGCYTWSESGGIGRSNAKWSWKKSSNWRKPGYWQNDDYPVTCVSWNDASAYASWLTQLTGQKHRLPTEAEWEFAARAGSTNKYSFGSNSADLCRYANVADTTASPTGSKWSNKIKCSDRHWFPAATGSYRANAFGLHDMQGNVWEWTVDAWSDNYNNASTDGQAYTQGNTTTHVLRGGAWDSNASLVRVSNRSKSDRDRRAAMIGFRVVAEQ